MYFCIVVLCTQPVWLIFLRSKNENESCSLRLEIYFIFFFFAVNISETTFERERHFLCVQLDWKMCYFRRKSCGFPFIRQLIGHLRRKAREKSRWKKKQKKIHKLSCFGGPFTLILYNAEQYCWGKKTLTSCWKFLIRFSGLFIGIKKNEWLFIFVSYPQTGFLCHFPKIQLNVLLKSFDMKRNILYIPLIKGEQHRF